MAHVCIKACFLLAVRQMRIAMETGSVYQPCLALRVAAISRAAAIRATVALIAILQMPAKPSYPLQMVVLEIAQAYCYTVGRAHWTATLALLSQLQRSTRPAAQER